MDNLKIKWRRATLLFVGWTLVSIIFAVALRDFAVETRKEIEIFKIAEESYAYVFYILQRSN